MTKKEALKLQVGERLEAFLGNEWVPVYTVPYDDSYQPQEGYAVGTVFVAFRRAGRTRSGSLYPWRQAPADCLRRPANPIPANVYADWLEENGYDEAGQELRKAFPLEDGK